MNGKSLYKSSEHGNALIYVLVAIALFAALGFTLARQNQGADTKKIDKANIELFATEIIGYATQVRSVIDQMSFTGTDIDDYDFTEPGEAGFNNGSPIHKIYHPQGGGLSLATLPEKAINEVSSSPAAGWYLGRYNNIEWTASTNTEILLSAYQITQAVCSSINEKITGSDDIPSVSGDLEDYFTDEGSDSELTESACPPCEGYSMLCVSDDSSSMYAFYATMAER